MEGVGLGLVVGCTGSKESRWEGGKRLGSCKRKMVNIVHVGNSCGTQVYTLHLHFTHTFMYVLCMYVVHVYMNMNGIINIHECMCVYTFIHYMTYIHTYIKVCSQMAFTLLFFLKKKNNE